MDIHRRALILAFTAFVAISCGPGAVFTFDLEEIVYQEGDFPAGPAATVKTVDRTADWRYETWCELQLHDSRGSLLLTADVVVFTDKQEVNKAFDEFAETEFPATMRIVDPPDVGARIVAYEGLDDGGGRSFELVYRRCYALVSIRARLEAVPAVSRESVEGYAEMLDHRLMGVVCPV